MFTADDQRLMARALQLGEQGRFNCDPNPSVGCVIAVQGKVVGEGFTQPAGGPHAEIVALKAAGSSARGATVYVTLEPCAHTGRTGPCTEALIEAGVGRVIAAAPDPYSRVAGRGFEALKQAGIASSCGLLESAARYAMQGYFSRIERSRPCVRLKLAASLDGRTALANGDSQWLTGRLARQDVHRQRAAASAVMTGIGTVVADDPSLTVRLEDPMPFSLPARVLIDSSLRVSPAARLLEPPGTVIIFTGSSDARLIAGLAEKGARIEQVPATPLCRLDAVLTRLAELEFNTVWLEAGRRLAGAMLAAELVDELIVYFAPDVLGDAALGMFDLPALTSLDQRRRFEISDVRRFGRDLRVTLAPTKVSARSLAP